MSKVTFRTTMDTSATVITTVVTLLLGATIFSVIWTDTPWYLKVLFTLVFGAIILFSWLYSPRAYSCTEKELQIIRGVGILHIEMRDILNIRSAEENEMNRLIRIGASGGVFGYYGKFYDSKHRNFKMYGRQLNNKVLVFTKTGLVVLMPDDMEGFIRYVRKGMIK